MGLDKQKASCYNQGERRVDMRYKETEWSPAWCKERHVLETPEVHEKTDLFGQGMGVPDGPHCDWCWEPWPCDTSRMVIEWEELRFRLDSLEK